MRAGMPTVDLIVAQRAQRQSSAWTDLAITDRKAAFQADSHSVLRLFQTLGSINRFLAGRMGTDSCCTAKRMLCYNYRIKSAVHLP